MPKARPIELGEVQAPSAEAVRALAGIWTRLFQSVEPALSAEAARAILALKFPPEDMARMHELAAKARAGEMSKAERDEADVYGEVGSILGILQSKARVALRKTGRKTRSRA